VTPRFRGAYPHAFECGVDHMKLITNNLQGKANPVCIGNYEEGLVMMKYNEIRMTKA
jgi:carbamoyl-phosphate synthase large subunit